MKKYWNWKKTTGLMMACAVICGTTGIALAEEKQDDKASAVETVRTYEGDEGDMTLRINVPQVVGKEGYVAEINDKILDLTTDYEARADWEVAQYKDAFLATGGTEKEFADKDIQVYVDYDVKSETKDQVSFVLKAYNNMVSADYIYECFNVDLKDNSETTADCTSMKKWAVLPPLHRKQNSISMKQAIPSLFSRNMKSQQVLQVCRNLKS